MNETNKELDTENTTLNAPMKSASGEAVPASSLFAADKTTAAADTADSTNLSPKASTLVDGSKKTWGEKMYDTIVYKFFGFGVNLTVSSYLTYWINHSARHLPFTKTTPAQLSVNVKNWLEGSKLTAGIPGFKAPSPEGRKGIANAMGNALILTTGGHILIPIIKFFEDRKTSIVKWLDGKHYGADELQAPEIQAAHDRIAEEIRPTWLSTAISRIVSIGAVQLSSRTFGHDENFINKAGKKFNIPVIKDIPGIDSGAERAGAAIVEGGYLPVSFTKKMDNFLVKSTRSDSVIRDKITEGQFKDRSPSTMLLKYGVSDIIYTYITAKLIKPTNNFLIRNFSFLRKEPEKAPTMEKPAIRQAALYVDAAPADSKTSLFSDTPVLERSTPDVKTHRGNAMGKIHDTAPEMAMEGAAAR